MCACVCSCVATGALVSGSVETEAVVGTVSSVGAAPSEAVTAPPVLPPPVDTNSKQSEPKHSKSVFYRNLCLFLLFVLPALFAWIVFMDMTVLNKAGPTSLSRLIVSWLAPSSGASALDELPCSNCGADNVVI